jgi:molecular chaperone Hsp33
MSELHKFIFEGLPVRGALVVLTDAWQEVLRRRAANSRPAPTRRRWPSCWAKWPPPRC